MYINLYSEMEFDNQCEIRHKLYNAAYSIHKNCGKYFVKTNSFLINSEIMIPLEESNIKEILHDSLFLNCGAENDYFVKKLKSWNKDIDLLSNYKHYAKDEFIFVKFLEHYLKESVSGLKIHNVVYIKFYFNEMPSDLAYSSIGRTYIDYNKQLLSGEKISDSIFGSGLSAGYLDKTFMYFENYESYGEKLLVLRPILLEKYRLHDYECLGKKFIVKKVSCLDDPGTVNLIVSRMSIEAKDSFIKSNYNRYASVNDYFGRLDKTLNIMENLGNDRYSQSIAYLRSLL